MNEAEKPARSVAIAVFRGAFRGLVVVPDADVTAAAVGGRVRRKNANGIMVTTQKTPSPT